MLKSLWRRFFPEKIPPFTGPTFPKREEANQWMTDRVEYFKRYYPEDAHMLFDRSRADYLPKAVHVGSCFRDEHLAHYRELKKQNPDLVQKAKETNYLRYTWCRIGDIEDFYGEEIDTPNYW